MTAATAASVVKWHRKSVTYSPKCIVEALGKNWLKTRGFLSFFVSLLRQMSSHLVLEHVKLPTVINAARRTEPLPPGAKVNYLRRDRRASTYTHGTFDAFVKTVVFFAKFAIRRKSAKVWHVHSDNERVVNPTLTFSLRTSDRMGEWMAAAAAEDAAEPGNPSGGRGPLWRGSGSLFIKNN